jgi:hypothetical protein
MRTSTNPGVGRKCRSRDHRRCRLFLSGLKKFVASGQGFLGPGPVCCARPAQRSSREAQARAGVFLRSLSSPVEDKKREYASLRTHLVFPDVKYHLNIINEPCIFSYEMREYLVLDSLMRSALEVLDKPISLVLYLTT